MSVRSSKKKSSCGLQARAEGAERNRTNQRAKRSRQAKLLQRSQEERRRHREWETLTKIGTGLRKVPRGRVVVHGEHAGDPKSMWCLIRLLKRTQQQNKIEQK